ncbi:MAG: hypothetical protein RID15_04170 [Marinovum algicola]|jgi:hypothetical protein|uniref:DUF6916 domain-containing protein n=1 Tax=Marinovum algicola TaxID=42444 RepID=A0A975ZML7_9RHOB|nr:MULTISPECIES: hypothetical protein [Marinovum]AKO96782.1 hypothetical protein MALG_01605 [Marinovum algicola DG 898]MDD9740728.1 hypothetical protein [Marinovum sp. SP66]SEJ05612.1 hypothetical protein SAMN04487940_10385 [Marinovum algicola]SLN19006.1 hypothetical protein MAA5396_00598 [Marinovum algicola]
MTIDIAAAAPEDFDSLIGDIFAVDSRPDPVRLVLDNVKRFEGSSIRDNEVEIDGRILPPRQAFALTFEGPREPQLDSQMFEIRHPQLGVLRLFLSPFRQDRTCMLYEAVFN